MPLRKTKIGYDREHFGWNPGGAACSNKCDGCWSLAKVGPRMKCPKCQDNIVHLHTERLGDPAKRRKPATILVNFTCDTWDGQRLFTDIRTMMTAAAIADWHTYIFLTKNPGKMRDYLASHPGEPNDNYYWGLTIRNQADADAKLPVFLPIPGKLWISYEPAWEEVEWGFGENMGPGEDSAVGWAPCDVGGTRHQHTLFERCCRRIEGIIVGHDNRRDALGTDTLDHIRSTVEQCKAAGIRCYIKQLWIDGKLRTDPQYFPEDLRIRDLPWGEKEQGND